MFRLAVIFAVVGTSSAAYNATFARDEIFYLSAAAYSLTPNACLPKVAPDAQ
ncbi:hypothetical protein AAVH_32672, partial [Aphelenchoides avenae]